MGRVPEVEAEDRKRSRGGPSGARSEDVTSGARPVPGEGRGLRLVQPGGRKEGEERWRLGRPGALLAAGFPRPDSPAGASRWGARGRLGARPRPPGVVQLLCSVLQVYPEPRSESECLSNIREFLRGCGASLRLEVSGWGRGSDGAGGRGCWQGLGGPVGRPEETGVTARSSGAQRPGSRAAPGCERGPRAWRSHSAEPQTLPSLQ